MNAYPWKLNPPSPIAELLPPDDVHVTIDRWPRLAFQEHYHDAFNWLVPVRPGTMVVRVAGRSVHVNGNSWICLFPNEAHAVESVTEGMEVLSLFLSHEEMYRAFRELGMSLDREEPFILGSKGEIAQGLAFQWAELTRPLERDREVLSRFRPFLCAWLWNFYRRGDEDENFASLLKIKIEGLGEKIAGYVSEHLDQSPFPWKGLANDLKLSQRTLQRKISEGLGITPTEVLLRIRVEAARRLLEDPAYDIALIALKCGFSSQSHFSNVFKARSGASPRRFRRERIYRPRSRTT